MEENKNIEVSPEFDEKVKALKESGEDDGTLKSLLNAVKDDIKVGNNDFYDCELIKMTKLINKTFIILDFNENVTTKFSGEGKQKAVVKCKKIEGDEDEFKFITGSTSIIEKLRIIKKANAFPRKVTLISKGNNLYDLK